MNLVFSLVGLISLNPSLWSSGKKPQIGLTWASCPFFWSFLVAPSKLSEPIMRKQTEISVFKGGSSACRRDKSNRPSGQKSSPVFAGSDRPTSWSLGRLCHWNGCPVAWFSPQSLLARVLVKILTVLNSQLMDLLRNRAAAKFFTSTLICVYSFSSY